MKQYLFILILLSVLLFEKGFCQLSTQTRKNKSDFLPPGYTIFQEISADLNKDGQNDCILIIKATDKKNIVVNNYHEKVDRNRRGIIVLFKKNGTYQSGPKNYKCFSSENEDGGVYMPPDLIVSVVRGNLRIHYAHGRYGYWWYVFRYQNLDFELIGYESSDNTGPLINSKTSINFLTGKKIEKENVNERAESGEEVFKETVSKVKVTKPLKLSEVADFDELLVTEGF